MRSALISCALVLVSATATAAPRPQWVVGPTAIAGTAKARNPDVAVGGGFVHVVYRVRGGGLATVVAKVSGAFGAEKPLPGTMTSAAATGPFNYPVIAVDDAGVASIAWAPPSGETSRGLSFARVGSDGTITLAPKSISTRWVETIAIASLADGAHVMVTAIKTATDPADAEGVFDVVIGPAGTPKEIRLHTFGNAKELAAARSPKGIGLIGRLTVFRRWDYEGTWSTLTNSDFPTSDGVTSIGRPKLAFDGPQEIWATIGWVGTTPTHVLFKDGGSKSTAWTKISSSTVLDPPTADGEPAPSLAVNALGERGVAWLADAAPRLRFAIGDTTLGAEAAMPGTDDATTMAMTAEGNAFRVVFVDGTGSLKTGLVANVDDALPDAGTPDASSPVDASIDASGPVDARPPIDATAPTSDAAATSPAIAESSGCGCRTGARDPNATAALLLAIVASCMRRAKGRRITS